MLDALCCLALLVPSVSALQVKSKEDVKPKSASPEGVELLWQRPSGKPKGILLYLHGCHGKATGMWTSDGADGFHFDVCDTTKKQKCGGFVEEILMRQKARKKGYVVAAVSGGVGSPRGCMNTNDVPRIQLAMKYLIEQEKDLADVPVIMTGHSSGGRVLPELVSTGAGIKNAKCIVPIADEIRVKGDSGAPLGPTPGYPEDVSAFFIHMERDTAREDNVINNIHQMKAKGVRTSDLKVPAIVPVTPELFNAEGYGLDNQTSNRLFRSLQKAKLIDGTKTLMRNPYAVGNSWQEAFKKDKLMDVGGGYQTLQSFMDVAWSEHWMAGGRYIDQILDFCEKPGYPRKSNGANPHFDLLAKVKEINKQSDQWKAAQETKFSKLTKKDKAKQIAQQGQMNR